MIDIWHYNNNPIAISSITKNKFEFLPYETHTPTPSAHIQPQIMMNFSTLFPYFLPPSLQFISRFRKKNKIKSITMIKMFCWRLSQCLVHPKAIKRKIRGKGTWGRYIKLFLFVLQQWLNSERWDMGCRRDFDIINSILFEYFNF